MGVVDINLNPSKKDMRVFAVLSIVFFPVLGWILPAAGSNLLVIAGITSLFWVCAAAFDREHSARQKMFGILIPGLLLTFWGALQISGPAGFDERSVRLSSLVVLSAIGLCVSGLAIAPGSGGTALYRGWMYAAMPIGWTISHLLLGFVFFCVVTPIGLARRLLGRDAMCRTFDPNATTYWTAHEQAKDRKRYFKQF